MSASITEASVGQSSQAGGTVKRSVGTRQWLSLVLPVGLIVWWQVAVQFGWLSSRILPEPLAVLYAAWELRRRANCGSIWA